MERDRERGREKEKKRKRASDKLRYGLFVGQMDTDPK